MTAVRPKKEANRITKLWRERGPNTYPIDFELMIKYIVNPSSNGDRLKLVSDKFSSFDGLMIKSEDHSNQWNAIINESIEHSGRRNFTTAHEIFHFLGHRNLEEKFSCTRNDIYDFDESKFEIEANEFASQLLMPQDIIRNNTSQEFCYENVKTLANNLQVSVEALAYKWMELSTSKIAFFISRDGFVNKGYSSKAAYENGIFFKQGRELPLNCLTNHIHEGGTDYYSTFAPKVWHPEFGGHEYIHQTRFEDFTYTFLTFCD